ncbi:response regulator transcription factor [Paenibacillus kandeliae]|uniref:response regulator transcription factor n=1 Tax=Paenibacillus kandeliae TaxID=3231269 RepID=UPI0034588843
MQQNTEARDNQDRIRMLIVDDEPVICQGLRHTIDWCELGVEVVGEAYDGYEALELVAEYGVDLVLTDICMEGMDGLKLAEQLKAHFPQVHVIMISGHEEFDYARRAMKLGVQDYLLKPVEIDELISVVGGVVQQWQQRQTVQEEKLEVEAAAWLLRQARHIANDPLPEPVWLQGQSFTVLATWLEHYQERHAGHPPQQYAEIQQRWQHQLDNTLQAAGYRSVSCFEHHNLLVTLIVDQEKRNSTHPVHPPLQSIITQIIEDHSSEQPLQGGLSTTYDELAATSLHCQEAIRLLYQSVRDEQRLIIGADASQAVSMEQELPIIDTADYCRRLTGALFQQDHELLLQLIAQLFAEYDHHRYLLSDMVQTCEEVTILLRQRLRNSGLQEGASEPIIRLALPAYNSTAALQAQVGKEWRQLLEQLGRQGLDRHYWSIEKAKTMIRQQYDTDLKASEVAAWLKITPGYFSYIFKQGTGQSFTEYMNELRIQEAKKLLSTTPYKIFEIADQVGYREYKYFVSIFKQVTGMTPKEYRTLSVTRNHCS